MAEVAAAAEGSLDAAFRKVPFDEWLNGRDTGKFHWSISVAKPDFSFHQRLVSRIVIKVDGRDLEGRRGDGELVVFTQIKDSAGARYQNHHTVELSKLDEKIRSANIEALQDAFVVPGDYQVAVALLDTKTGEHAVRQTEFHVAPVKWSFFQEAWRDLPPVEFVPSDEPPDGWYHPRVQGRIGWAAPIRSAARINIILNVPPPSLESKESYGDEMSALIPVLKAFSQTGSTTLSQQVEVVDLPRRRSVFEQHDVKELDWTRLKTALAEANPASIDLHSLMERHKGAQYFITQTRHLLRASDQPSVLVVLSPPVAFESGEDLDPISLEALPSCRVYWIRYRRPRPAPMPFRQAGMGGYRRGPRGFGGPTRTRPIEAVVDQLAPTLKPLNPRIYDVETPEQMARAFVEIGEAILSQR
jgi:hypothetical protein